MQKLNFIDITETKEIFNADEVKKICQHLNRKFASFLNDEFFNLQSGYKGNQFQIKLTLSNKDHTFFYPIEAICIPETDSTEEETETVDASDIALLMVEYLTLYFEEFLSEDRNVFLPIDWSVHQSDDTTFFLRGFVRNLKIEKIADELLNTHGYGEQDILPISAEY